MSIEIVKPDNCDCHGCSAERRIMAGLAEIDAACMPRPEPDALRYMDLRDFEAKKRAWLEYRSAYCQAMARFLIGCLKLTYVMRPEAA